MVLISSQVLFSDKPFRIPSSLSITSADTSGEGREVMIKSDFSANSLGDFATLAPKSFKEFVKVSSKSLTVRSKLFLNKLPASFPPTLPKPINPIFILFPLLFCFL